MINTSLLMKVNKMTMSQLHLPVLSNQKDHTIKTTIEDMVVVAMVVVAMENKEEDMVVVITGGDKINHRKTGGIIS